MKKYIYKIKFFIFMQVICYGIVTLSRASIPYIEKIFFDSITGEGRSYSLAVLILTYTFCKISESIFMYIDNVFIWKGALEFENSLKKDFFRAIFNYNFEKFSKKDIGEYISIQGNDITELEQDYLEPFIDIIKSINMIIIYGVILFICVDYRIAIIIFIGSIITILIPKFTSKILSEKRNEYLEQMSSYVSIIKDFLQGFKIIQRRTRRNINIEHEKVLNKTKNKRFIYGKFKSLTMMIEDFSMNILSIVTFIITGILLFKREITVGTGVATLGYINSFISPINSIIYDINAVNSLRKVKKKVISYIEEGEVKEKIIKKNFLDNISFNNVSFSYDNFFLKNISCVFKKNKKYVIVGHSGSGKSTLINILMGFIKPSDGNVTIDGKELNLIDTDDIMYCINQNEHIFIEDFINNATVFNSYSKDKTNEIISKLDIKIIDSIKNKENCQLLSGGEKQALAMIRMLTANTEIIVMDEPFSAVDERNSKILQEFLFRFNNKTVIMITHKLSDDLYKFDEIILMDNGEIIMQGHYDEIKNTKEFKKIKSNCNDI